MEFRQKLLCLSAALLLAGCASLPTTFDQPYSRAWPNPEQTRMGRFFEGVAAEDPGLSGVRLIADAREAFRVRFGFASLADKTLDLQYYLWKGDLTGQLLLYRALEAADRGVKVRILIDDIFHSGRDKVYGAVDAHANMEVRIFNPAANRSIGRPANFATRSKLNHRMHNKIFLVDNAVAILGGRNIGDDYFAIDPKLNFRDLDVLAVGPAARKAGAAYDLYWNSRFAVPITVVLKKPASISDLDDLRDRLKETLIELEALPYTVPLSEEATREALATLASELTWAEATVVVDPLTRFSESAESEFARLGRTIENEAGHELVAQTAYLIPTDEGVRALESMAGRGVRVRMLTNSLMSNNHLSVHAHYMKYRKALIEAGVELHELRADAALLDHFENIDDSRAGLHTKSYVIDRKYTIIGSYNLDPRSRVWNSEIGLLVTSEEFAALVLQEMEQDFDPANSFRVTVDENGQLQWTASGPNGPVVWKREPDSTFFKRLGARLISWIPIGNQL